MENKYCVYVHTNKANGLKYVGITGNEPEKRWQNGRGYARNKFFDNSIRKYGWDNFEHEILLSGVTKEEAEQLEKLTIACLNTIYPNGYNFDTGGNLQKTISEETRQRLKDSHKGQRVSESRKEQLKVEMRGENNPAAKAINQYSAEGKYIATYSTGVEAELITGVDRKRISPVCHHKYGMKLAEGFQWRFASECEPGADIAPVKKDTYRAIALYDKEGNFIKVYSSIVEASADTGKSAKAISSQASRPSKSPRSEYVWRYKEQGGRK